VQLNTLTKKPQPTGKSLTETSNHKTDQSKTTTNRRQFYECNLTNPTKLTHTAKLDQILNAEKNLESKPTTTSRYQQDYNYNSIITPQKEETRQLFDAKPQDG